MRYGQRLDDFSVSVSINGIPVTISDEGYVTLNHGDHYKVVLKNHSSLRCNATLKIDGNEMGSFRLNSYAEASIERPVAEDKKFTFFLTDSTEGQASGLVKGSDKNGLIEVLFEQEKDIGPFATRGGEPSMYVSKGLGGVTRGGGYRSDGLESASYRGVTRGGGSTRSANQMSMAGLASGGTGLQGKSHQSFVDAHSILLSNKKITITLRLVGRTDTKNYDAVTPLPGAMATPVPPPLPH